MRHEHKTFQAIEVGDGGDGRWAAYARTLWQAMQGLLTEEGRTPQGADRVRALFRAHMPELVPVLDRLAGHLDRPGAEAFLTHAALRPFTQACTQIGRSGTLLRNYDLRPDQCEGTIVSSRFLRPVIGMQDMLWGLLDGMNDAGLAVSITWGGRSAYGRGFAVLIVVRYLLETCDTVDEAVGRLRCLPVAVPQNLTLVDPTTAVTVFVGPDMSPTVAPDACAANHQHLPVTDEQERALRTHERLRAIRAAGADDVAAMLKPPLYRSVDGQGSRTLYTARYRPVEGRVTYHWPGESWQQSFGDFTPGSRSVTLGPAERLSGAPDHAVPPGHSDLAARPVGDGCNLGAALGRLVRVRPTSPRLCTAVVLLLIGTIAGDGTPVVRPGQPLPAAPAVPIAAAPSHSPTPSASPGPTFHDGDGPVGSFLTTRSGAVALTFDDGPDPVNTPKLLALLRERHIHATFCMVGFRVRDRPDLVRAIHADGHTLCNHSWQHLLNLAHRDDAYVDWDLTHTNDMIHAAVGPDVPIRYFRAPGGNFTPALVAKARSLGMDSIYWDVDPRDWEHTHDANASAHVARVVGEVKSRTRPGSIVLSHDNGQPDTVSAYRYLLPWLQERFTLEGLPTAGL